MHKNIKVSQEVQENGVYIVNGGKLIPLDTPTHGFGKQEITWQHGKVIANQVSYTQKFKQEK